MNYERLVGVGLMLSKMAIFSYCCWALAFVNHWDSGHLILMFMIGSHIKFDEEK